MTIHPPDSIQGLKLRVRQGLICQMTLGSTWCLLSTDWFNVWKRHVNYDTDMFSTVEVNHPAPGPIDNSSLVGDEPGDLKRGMYEGQDFVLLPASVYDSLELMYGGGPRIARDVISVGGTSTMQLQIELHPLKVYLCRDNDETRTLHVSRSATLNKLHDAIAKEYRTSADNCRLWIDTSDTAPTSDASMDWQSGAATRPAKGRRMTTDVTDVDGIWRYLRDSSTSIASLASLGTGPVRILVELADHISGSVSWPRDVKLNRWRFELRGGDMIDATDERGIWSEAEVVGAAPGNVTGGLTVHFRGWASKWDRVIAPSDLMTRIDPLFTHTQDWRSELEVGDKVEYRVKSEMDGEVRWVLADVSNVSGDRIEVKYKHGNLGKLNTAWTELNGEDVAEIHTHIKTVPPPQVDNFSGSYNRLGDYPKQSGYSSMNYNRHREGSSLAVGAVGLANLGNTCFMNAILQCLSASPSLLDTFMPPLCRFRSQINVDNPLGMHGKLASAYGRLVADMWSGRYSVVVPDALKNTIAEFRPQFGGYQQQDAQELLLFLLDGLHEDLNRIRGSKPYVVKLESNKGGVESDAKDAVCLSDEVLSKESWRRFLLRNDSELTDHWFGQLRSQVTCTTAHCGRLSTTFDEYSSLSLPLPVQHGVSITVTVYPLPYGSKPLKVFAEVDPLSGISDLYAVLNNAIEKAKADACVKMETSSNGGADGFVVVDKESDSPEEDYDMCADDMNGHTKHANEKSPIRSVDSHLHLCGLLTYQIPPRVYKSYSDKSLVRDITQMRDDLVAYQTRHPVSVTSFGASAFDVFFAVERVSQTQSLTSLYSGSYGSRWDLLPFPVVRVSYEADVTTIGELRADLHQIVLSRLRSTEGSDKYTAHFSTSNGSASMGQLSLNDADVVTSRANFTIVCVWSSDDTRDIFLDKEAISDAIAIDTRDKEASGPLSVYKCLAKFLERETLPEIETYYCSSCKQHKAPIKKFDLWSLPDMMVLQLKRFRYVPGAYFVHRDKVSDFVDYPIEGLDLSSYVIGPTPAAAAQEGVNPFLFDLVGVVEHIGGIGGGHYTATCKHPTNGKWYHFNDSSVSEVQAYSAVSAEAYVLFYRRR